MKKILLMTATLLAAPAAQAATLVTLADFDNAVSEDFEAVAVGSIDQSNAIFAALGITGVSGTGGSDAFGIRTDVSRSLGLTSGGDLEVVDPNGGTNSFDLITFSFAAPTTQFGIAFSDQNFSDRNVTFSLGGATVDTFSLSTTNGAGLNTFFFEASTNFDSITLDLNGAYIDAIHANNVAAVPLPAGLPLLLAGLGAMGLASRRKS